MKADPHPHPAALAPYAIAALPERELLLEMSRTLFWCGRPKPWAEWACTLPSDVVAELLNAEDATAREAHAQALAEAAALDHRLRAMVQAKEQARIAAYGGGALGMASWFPRRRVA